MRRLALAIIIPFLMSASIFAQESIQFNLKDLAVLTDFRLDRVSKEPNKLVVTAIDEDGNTDSAVIGEYSFVINGYLQSLVFFNGRAELRDSDQNSFLFIKYENAKSEASYHLYFNSSVGFFHIPLYLILLIPFLLIVVLSIFRKLLLLSIVLILFLIFFLVSGLDLPAFINLLKVSALSFFS